MTGRSFRGRSGPSFSQRGFRGGGGGSSFPRSSSNSFGNRGRFPRRDGGNGVFQKREMESDQQNNYHSQPSSHTSSHIQFNQGQSFSAFPGIETKPEVRMPSQPRISKMGRIIIRNLPFSTKENDLQLLMGKCGKITEVRIPRKNDGNMRGFGFVQFQSIYAAETAIKMFNATNLKGRPIAVDWAVAKSRYEEAKASQVSQEEVLKAEEDADSDEEDDIKTEPADVKADVDLESDLSEPETDIESEPEGSSLSGDDEEDGTEPKRKKKPRTPKMPSDVDEGRTLFVRNLPFTAAEDDLIQFFKKFGVVKYARVCFHADSGHSKGSGFVQFIDKEDALRALRQSESGGGLKMDDRDLICCFAETPKQRRKTEKNQTEKPKKDARNLYLLHESRVRKDDAAPPMSQNDERKRAALDKKKIEALKNLHMFVSSTRLSVHNLPKSVDNHKLKELFMNAAEVNKYRIKECLVIQDKKSADPDKRGKSLGYGFVEFTHPDDAIKALKELNNNPEIFTDERRPIVEFAVENKAALLKKKTRLEHSQAKLNMLRSQQKPPEGKNAKTSNQKSEKGQRKDLPADKPKSKNLIVTKNGNAKDRFQKEQRSGNRVAAKTDAVDRYPNERVEVYPKEENSKKMKPKEKPSKKRKLKEVEKEDDFSAMVKKYKSKIQLQHNEDLQAKSGSRWFDE